MRTNYSTDAEDLGAERRARVEVLIEADFAASRASYRPGETIGPLPYGLHSMEQQGVRLTQHQGQLHGPAAKLQGRLENKTQMYWDLPLRAAPTLNGCNALLAIFERYGYLPSLAKTRGLPPFSGVPLIVVSCWLAEVAMRASGRSNRTVPYLASPPLEALRRRVRGIDLLVYFSANQREIYSEVLRIPENRQLAIPFGVDTSFYTPLDGARDLDVVSVGRDGGRDFATLLDAARGAEFSITVITPPIQLAGLSIPDNVHAPGPVSHLQYRELLRRAKVVVIPTRELAYPTGQSVALEAMSCGSAIVATSTVAMSDYLETDVNCVAVPVGDAPEMRNAIVRLLGDEQMRDRIGARARNDALTRFTDRDMWSPVIAASEARGFW